MTDKELITIAAAILATGRRADEEKLSIETYVKWAVGIAVEVQKRVEALQGTLPF